MLITTYKEANQLKSSCILLPTATVPVVTPHVYSVANQVQAHDVYLSCVMCVSYPVCTPKSCAHASFLSLARVKRASTFVYVYVPAHVCKV